MKGKRNRINQIMILYLAITQGLIWASVPACYHLPGSYEGRGKPKNVIFGHNSGFIVSVQIQNELFNYLARELIAGESGNSQPLSFIASVQSLKLIVVGVG